MKTVGYMRDQVRFDTSTGCFVYTVLSRKMQNTFIKLLRKARLAVRSKRTLKVPAAVSARTEVSVRFLPQAHEHHKYVALAN